MTTAAANITASGHSLREWIEDVVGSDPIADPTFGWSNSLACDECDVHDSTALLIFSDDGATTERLCFHCAVAR